MHWDSFHTPQTMFNSFQLTTNLGNKYELIIAVGLQLIQARACGGDSVIIVMRMRRKLVKKVNSVVV